MPPADAIRVEIAPPLDKTGNFVVAPKTTWADVPPIEVKEGTPRGKLIAFTVSGQGSPLFPGNYNRNCWVYIPAGYQEGTELPFIVDHDGRADAVVQTQLIATMDNYIAEKRRPMMAGVFIAPAGRSVEYDTVSGKYAEYIETEILPVAEKTGNIKLTKDRNGRGVIGQSSGSAAAMAMAWFGNPGYSRVISYSGTFVNIQRNAEFPRGAWHYHENLIPNSPKKDIRIWLHVSDRDNSFNAAETSYNNWPMANNKMADALKAKGYEYQYLWSDNSGHVERGVERQTIPQAMEWVWKTYKAK
jgi:enterochelin esterase-like enzyme